ncbi:MAG: dephospho-CoA kinase [Kiritimatiellae bacterium]|jgi:dephospho-CoA kinase|nr:dephospho-CoA kinase [Kiritimatiellia bacterium]
MVRIVITGGIACGKTLFCAYLSKLGFDILDCDHIVHDLESPGGAAVESVRREFGEHVILADGSVDRKRLGDLIFRDEGLRNKLNAIVHPLVEDSMKFWFESEHSGVPVVVIPLLFELGWESRYDCIVAVVSDEQLQIERLVEKRGITREHAEKRLESQWPVRVKAERSDIVVINNGSAEALKKEAERVSCLLKMRYE